MKPIGTKTHGVMDYFMGIILIATPIVLKLENGSASIVLSALGVAAIVYSLVTDYEFGLLRIIPMNIHLALDVLSGIFLAASPWLFGFAGEIYLPHVILGVIEIAAGLMTRSKRD